MIYQIAPKFQWLPWWTADADWDYAAQYAPIYSHFAGWLWWQFHWYGNSKWFS